MFLLRSHIRFEAFDMGAHVEGSGTLKMWGSVEVRLRCQTGADKAVATRQRGIGMMLRRTRRAEAVGAGARNETSAPEAGSGKLSTRVSHRGTAHHEVTKSTKAHEEHSV